LTESDKLNSEYVKCVLTLNQNNADFDIHIMIFLGYVE